MIVQGRLLSSGRLEALGTKPWQPATYTEGSWFGSSIVSSLSPIHFISSIELPTSVTLPYPRYVLLLCFLPADGGGHRGAMMRHLSQVSTDVFACLHLH